MRQMLRHISCIGLLLGVSLRLMACGDLDEPDYVKDLRVLAIRLDPPDQLLTLTSLQRNSVSQSTQSVTITVLIADPHGSARPIDYSLSTCSRLDVTNRNCTSASAGYQQLRQGQITVPDGFLELQLDFAASDMALAQALEQDPYHGTQGLWLPVQIELSAGANHILATKLVVFRFADAAGHFLPNQNPNLLGMQVGEVDWPEQTPYTFSLAALPKDGYVLNPVFNSNEQQRYEQPNFAGTAHVFQESWIVDYFSTWGGLSPTTAGGDSPTAAGKTPLASSTFRPPKDAQMGFGVFWFVVRDGRGGENWLVRTARLTP